MEYSKLYTALSGLNLTDNKLYDKIVNVENSALDVNPGAHININETGNNATISVNVSGLILSGNTGLVTGGAVYSALSSKQNLITYDHKLDISLISGNISSTTADKVAQKLTFDSDTDLQYDGSVAKTIKPGSGITFTTSNNDLTIATSGLATTQYVDSSVSGKLDKPANNGEEGQYLAFDGVNIAWQTIGIPETISDLNDGASVLTGLTNGTKISITGSGHTRTISHSGSYTTVSNGFKKITVDSTGHVTSTSNVTSGDLPSHTHTKSQISDFSHTHTKSEITDIGSVFTYKGSQTNYAAISGLAASVGDVYHANDTGKEFVCTVSGTASHAIWEELGTTVDTSIYQEKNTAVTHTASTAVGSATKGVYIASNGVATAMTYSLNKDVPSNAVFTDTTYSLATSSLSGLMSASDKAKLDDLPDKSWIVNGYGASNTDTSDWTGINLANLVSDIQAINDAIQNNI